MSPSSSPSFFLFPSCSVNVEMHPNYSDEAACSRQIGLSEDQTCEQHGKGFFPFDFASETPTKAETNGSPLKSIQETASAVLGGIWSALDTAMSILNEDMNMEESTEGMMAPDNDGNVSDSMMDVMSESIVNNYVYSEQKLHEPTKSPAIVNPSKEIKGPMESVPGA